MFCLLSHDPGGVWREKDEVGKFDNLAVESDV